MTPPRTAHPWAVLDGERPLFHVPGTYDPPEYARDDALEQLWRRGQKQRPPQKQTVIQLSFWEKAA